MVPGVSACVYSTASERVAISFPRIGRIAQQLAAVGEVLDFEQEVIDSALQASQEHWNGRMRMNFP